MAVRTEPLAFPEAVGFGRNSLGGSGGVVYTVTNLNDSGTGSLREACEASGARIVVFAVGGVIDLLTPIELQNPNISILGQTSPGGIMLTGSVEQPSRLIAVATDDVIIRFLTLRRSESSSGFNAGDNIYVANGNNIIIDHVSTSWSSDGNIDVASYARSVNSRTLDNVTVQYCLITNSYGGTNKSMLVAGDPSQLTVYRNAFINSASRNPALSSDLDEDGTGLGYVHNYDGNYEIINNLWYDCLNGLTAGNIFEGSTVFNVNAINNWRSAASGLTHSRRMIRLGSAPRLGKELMYSSGNVAGSLIDAGIESDPEWRMVQHGTGSGNANTIVPASMRSATPLAFPIVTDNVTLWTGAEVRTSLISEVGSYLNRDSEDTRAINDIINDTSTYNNTTNTFPVYTGGTAPTDTSGDGMPDAWKTSKGLNPATDDSEYLWVSGYMGVEEYANELGAGTPPPIVDVTSVSILPETVSIEVGVSQQLTETVLPTNATNKTGVWSSNTGNATVDTNGLVTGVSEGSATITFTTNDGSFTDTSVITVTVATGGNITYPLTDAQKLQGKRSVVFLSSVNM